MQVTFVSYIPLLFYGMVLRRGSRFVVSVRIYITLLCCCYCSPGGVRVDGREERWTQRLG